MKIIDNMQYTIQPPQHINTTITLPASKSVCNRALVIQALAGGSSLPANLSDCDDTRLEIPFTIVHASCVFDISIFPHGPGLYTAFP